jgi:hypothetical protein
LSSDVDAAADMPGEQAEQTNLETTEAIAVVHMKWFRRGPGGP